MKKIMFLILFLAMFIFGVDKVNAQTLENGRYIIKSALNTNMALDVYRGKAVNEANIQLFSLNGANNQQWDVKSLGNGYYSIKSALSENFSLDVYKASKKPETNLQLFTYSGTSNQEWIIKDAGKGYYYIISRCNNLALDVHGGRAFAQANIQLYTQTGNSNQKFLFEKVEMPEKTIENGIYTIKSALDDNMIIEPSNGIATSQTNVQLYNSNNRDYQKWNVKYLNDGYYSITMYLNDQMSLDVHGAGKIPETNVEIFPFSGSNNQQWIIKDAGEGYYYIISKCNNLALDVHGGRARASSNIQTFTKTGNSNQKFKFEQAKETSAEHTLDDGTYIIKSALNNKKVLDVHGGATNNGTNVEIFGQHGGNNQKWNIKDLGNGYYTIQTALSDNMYLNVHNAGKTTGTNVELNANNNFTDNQQWIIKDAGEGYYYIISKCNNLYLETYNGSSSDGANVVTGTYKGQNLQKFKFISTEVNVDEQQFKNGVYSFASLTNLNQVFDVYRSVRFDNTNVTLFTNNNQNNQLWYVTYVKDGYYSITSALNIKVALTAEQEGTAEGTNICISKYKGTDSQLWRIKNLGNNEISLISKASELYVTGVDAVAKDGTNIVLKQSNGTNTQKFKMNEYKNTKIYHGIDISHWNFEGGKSVNFDTLASNTDVNFVIIHAGYGQDTTDSKTKVDSQMDSKYEYMVEQCEKYNIPYAVYLYSYATDISQISTITVGDINTIGEANHMLNLLDKVDKKGYKPILGTQVFLDMEDASTQSAGKERLTNIADTFCSKIQAGGYSCGIYANKNWFTNYLDQSKLGKKYTLWLAEYFPMPNPTFKDAEARRTTYMTDNFTYWQFASDGLITGTKGNTDLNLGYDIFEK